MNSFYRIPDSFFSGFHYDKEESKWKEGDWVAHVTGMNVEMRVQAALFFGNGCPGVEDHTEGVVITTDGLHPPG